MTEALVFALKKTTDDITVLFLMNNLQTILAGRAHPVHTILSSTGNLVSPKLPRQPWTSWN